MITRKGRHGLFSLQKFKKGGKTHFPAKQRTITKNQEES